MIRKIITLSIITYLFTAPALTQAGQLFRFTDENGTKTLSRSLPAEAAQKGYEVLNDKTMRVIERVPPALTDSELAEQKRLEQVEKEAQQQAEQAAIEAEKARQQQAIIDKTLLNTYRSEADLINARDADIGYRHSQIEQHQAKLPVLEQHLIKVQQEAAEHELSGGKLTENMQKRLNAAQQEIDIRQQTIAQLEAEIESLSTKYEAERARLNYLLQARN